MCIDIFDSRFDTFIQLAVLVRIEVDVGCAVAVVVLVTRAVAVSVFDKLQQFGCRIVVVRCGVSERVGDFCQENAVLAVDRGGGKLFRRARGGTVQYADVHEITEIALVQYRQPKMSKEVERVWDAYNSS